MANQIKTETGLKPANKSFHNSAIIKDCLGINTIPLIDKFIDEETARYKTDSFGNIKEIDGMGIGGGNFVYHFVG